MADDNLFDFSDLNLVATTCIYSQQELPPEPLNLAMQITDTIPNIIPGKIHRIYIIHEPNMEYSFNQITSTDNGRDSVGFIAWDIGHQQSPENIAHLMINELTETYINLQSDQLYQQYILANGQATTTHDAGGKITEKDYRLAELIDGVAG